MVFITVHSNYVSFPSAVALQTPTHPSVLRWAVTSHRKPFLKSLDSASCPSHVLPPHGRTYPLSQLSVHEPIRLWIPREQNHAGFGPIPCSEPSIEQAHSGQWILPPPSKGVSWGLGICVIHICDPSTQHSAWEPMPAGNESLLHNVTQTWQV